MNDAFGTAHRAHASTAGMARFVKEKAAGFLIQKEVEYLGKALGSPARPFVAILGGAKVSDKIKVIENLLAKVDALCIGGAMAYTFLKAQGVEVGKSRVEEDKLELARQILERAAARKVDLLLPVDHVCGTEPKETAKRVVVNDRAIPTELMGLDIGPKTLDALPPAHPRREDGLLERAHGPLRAEAVRRGHVRRRPGDGRQPRPSRWSAAATAPRRSRRRGSSTR